MLNKLFMLAVIALFAFTANAQSVTASLYSNPASGIKLLDTIANTGTVTMRSPTIKGDGAISTTVGVTFTKLTGTVAGTATLQGSIDGVKWYTASSTTYTVTDVAEQSTSWVLTGRPYLYFGITVTGSGTSTYTVNTGKLLLTRNPR